MPQTASEPVQLGWVAPDFDLPEPLTGRTISLRDFQPRKAVLVVFTSNVCPFVKLIESAFVEFAKDYEKQGVGIIAINANAQEIKAGEDAEGVARTARDSAYPFPYLRDETQSVAQAYGAACTPDFFLLDSDLRLFYRGQFDAARPGNGVTPNGEDLRRAVDALLAGQPAPQRQVPSIGCNIKWRDGDDHGVRQVATALAA